MNIKSLLKSSTFEFMPRRLQYEFSEQEAANGQYVCYSSAGLATQSNQVPATPPAGSKQAMSAQQANYLARRLILRGGQVGKVYYPPALDVWQQLAPQLPATVGPGSVLNFYLRNVGLVKRCIIRMKASLAASTTSEQFLTGVNSGNPGFGLSNFVSNVIFYDLGNNQRINTAGWHLTMLSSAKRRRVFGAAYTSDSPLGFGNNNNRVMYAPATIAANGTGELDFMLEIPFVRDDSDLRGSVFANLTQATMLVQITLNPNMFVSSTADASLAMYQSAGSDLMTMSAFSWTVYQNYLDQLPGGNANPILPALDIGTGYMLNNTTLGLPVANQNNAAPFTNARTFQSLCFYYDNNGTLNVNGTDLNNVQLQSANTTSIIYLEGKMLGLMNRNVFMDDPPPGMYYLSFRHRPIDTNQYGNMQFILNPSSVGGSAAYIGLGWEAYAIIGLVNQGGSLPAGS